MAVSPSSRGSTVDRLRNDSFRLDSVDGVFACVSLFAFRTLDLNVPVVFAQISQISLMAQRFPSTALARNPGRDINVVYINIESRRLS